MNSQQDEKRQVDSLMLMPPDGAEHRVQPWPWRVLHMYVSDFRGQLNKPSVFLKTSLSQNNSEDIYTKKGSWNHFLSAGPLANYLELRSQRLSSLSIKSCGVEGRESMSEEQEQIRNRLRRTKSASQPWPSSVPHCIEVISSFIKFV